MDPTYVLLDVNCLKVKLARDVQIYLLVFNYTLFHMKVRFIFLIKCLLCDKLFISVWQQDLYIEVVI